MAGVHTDGRTDGRTARAHRTRRAVVDALLALIEDGDLRPTAPRIAERAGVSLRSVFQHFTDLESLFAEAANRQLERFVEVAGRVPREGSFRVRLQAFVAQRSGVLEFLTPVRRASLLQEPFSAELRAGRDRALALARREVAQVFAPELAALRKPVRDDVLDAVDVLTSWAAWDLLRQSLAVDGASRVMLRGIASLLGQPTA
jgi:AcrR family transcriptional regulator